MHSDSFELNFGRDYKYEPLIDDTHRGMRQRVIKYSFLTVCVIFIIAIVVAACITFT